MYPNWHLPLSIRPLHIPPQHLRHAQRCLDTYSSARTLDGGFGPRGRESSHGADHEVLEDDVGVGALATPVLAEIGDLSRRAVAHALEGRVEGRGRGVGRLALAGRGGERAHRQRWQRRARQCSQHGARGGRESGHGVCSWTRRWGGQLGSLEVGWTMEIGGSVKL